MSVVFHLTGKIESQEVITTERSDANVADLEVAILPAPQADGSSPQADGSTPQADGFASSKVPMMTTLPKSKEQFTGTV